MRTVTAGIVGFLVAPLIAALILSATTRLVPPSDIIARIGMLPVFYYFSAVATCLLGLPVFLIFRRLRLLRWWSVLASGFVIGALMGALVGESNHAQLPDMLLMAGAGAVAALGFWAIWSQGREIARSS
jgi:hypothetical protein